MKRSTERGSWHRRNPLDVLPPIEQLPRTKIVCRDTLLPHVEDASAAVENFPVPAAIVSQRSLNDEGGVENAGSALAATSRRVNSSPQLETRKSKNRSSLSIRNNSRPSSRTNQNAPDVNSIFADLHMNDGKQTHMSVRSSSISGKNCGMAPQSLSSFIQHDADEHSELSFAAHEPWKSKTRSAVPLRSKTFSIASSIGLTQNLPSRMKEIDPETNVPEDIFTAMLKLGREANNGQHKMVGSRLVLQSGAR